MFLVCLLSNRCFSVVAATVGVRVVVLLLQFALFGVEAASMPIFAIVGASSLDAVLESVQPGLAFEDLVSVAISTGLLVLVLAGDGDSANVRLKHFLADKARKHNADRNVGLLLLLDVSCGGHILHRIVEVAFKMHQLIPSLHATAFICVNSNAVEVLLRMTKEIIREDLESGGFVANRRFRVP
jgi:hypothetical protein